MTQIGFLKRLRSYNIFRLLIIVFVSCGLLIFINFFTIKILSATRAYVNGESHYSKAQKDAVRHLITYMYTEDPKEWQLFSEELKVPMGDGAARVALLSNNVSDETIKKYFRAGRNSEDDLDNLIWLFRNFKDVPFLAKAIGEWEEGDKMIKELLDFGNEINRSESVSNMDTEVKQKILLQLSIISNKLTVNERNFSNTIGEGTRTIKDVLIIINILFILVIISSVSFYHSIMVKRLVASKKEVQIKNDNLIMLNSELDNFVYSVSHDLRSPITSLKGLIELAKLEDDFEKINYYLMLMSQSLNRQDQFIRDIIDYSKNKRIETRVKTVSLSKLIEETISLHNYNRNAEKIVITKDILVDEIQSDSLRLKIIMNNLLSNAIKYVDESKDEMKIAIRTYNLGVFHKIEIEDNGIGIQEEYKDRIFNMFFVVNSNKGSGLGLYIVQETLKKLNGNISVISQNNVGSKFIVTIPNLYLYEN
ncbi:two-component sensor histidine kinase [Flavobacterium gilvum]|uniref:histidine kinase n=1 Tax=Flavobacterium gilvum TaxID=1492737 RepID=A0AAC9N6X4_9FLAO|nr:two-component sensor histidine kinase [Flavobacterium gilvum]